MVLGSIYSFLGPLPGYFIAPLGPTHSSPSHSKEAPFFSESIPLSWEKRRSKVRKTRTTGDPYMISIYIYFHDTMKELFVIFLSDVLCLQDWGSSKLTIIGSHQSLVPLMLVGELTGAAFYQGMSGFNMFHSPFRREEPCHENS
jgi:hypothetical protein